MKDETNIKHTIICLVLFALVVFAATIAYVVIHDWPILKSNLDQLK